MGNIYKELDYCIELLSVLYDVPKIDKVVVSGRMKRQYGSCIIYPNGKTELRFAKILLDEEYPIE